MNRRFKRRYKRGDFVRLEDGDASKEFGFVTYLYEGGRQVQVRWLDEVMGNYFASTIQPAIMTFAGPRRMP